MKATSAALAAHLEGPVTTLATCWQITRRDGARFHFTDHDRDIAFEGALYRASAGYARSAIASDAGLAPDTLEVEGVFEDDALSEAALRAGLFDGAEARLFLVNWADPGMGALRLRRGWFGEVVLGDGGVFRTELRGLTQALSQRIGALISPACRADLGDGRCRVPLHPPAIARETAYGVGQTVRVPLSDAPGSARWQDRAFRCTTAGTTAATLPAYDPTPGAGTADGSALFVAEQAWTRAGSVIAALDRSRFTTSLAEPRAVDGWFAGGVLAWESGANAGRAMEVIDWVQASATITLFLPMGFAIATGDRFSLHPGCDKRLDTCIGRFANVLNFRGEPYLPGHDALMQYPDAR